MHQDRAGRGWVVVAATAALVVGVAGCGDDEQVATDPAGQEPTTPQSLGWVAAEHLPGTPEGGYPAADIEELGAEAVGATVLVSADGGGTVAVTVAVGEGGGTAFSDDVDDEGCPEIADGCEPIDGGGLVFWQDEEPEEDPGVIYVVVPKGEHTVVVFQSSEPVAEDPRTQDDLTVSVDAMVDLALDPRVDTTTSQEAVDGGEALAWWGGEPDY